MLAAAKIKLGFKRYLSETSGNIGIMLGLAAIPMVLAAGAAIDFARFNATQTHTQMALDAGALAGASMKKASDGERIAAAQKIFDANIKTGAAAGYKIDVNYKIVDKKVVGSAKPHMPTAFMHIGGTDELSGETTVEVGILTDKKAEIALVLDYSGSMRETAGSKVKYKAMRDASKKLIDDLSKSDPDKVKFALVPFSHHVYVTLPASHVLGATTPTWTGCTQDRPYPYNLSNSTPGKNDNTKWNQPQAPDHIDDGCDPYPAKNLKLMDLTDDFKGLNAKLDVMRPNEYTHIALGVEFGYHVLSPNAPFTSSASFNDKETKKFMVVLTDGKQTEPGFGKNDKRTVGAAEDNLESLCDNVKGDNITIITLAFDLNDTETRQRLKDCSTNPDTDFFVADDSADLDDAFESIKKAIANEVYVSK